MDKFIGQLTIEDLACLVRGEGMGSKRVRPGTGCAFGGVSSRLLDFGIPVAAGTDGPSGLRFDNGDAASLVPIEECLRVPGTHRWLERFINVLAARCWQMILTCC